MANAPLRNIRIAYALTVTRFSWFWLGVWVLYYLKFTNYTGIGLIETVMILTATLLEIPTGAIADLLGRKWTLCISLILQALGALIMAGATNLSMLVMSVIPLSIGAALFSGTLEALVYDSLKEAGQADRYEKIITNISSLQLIVPALCGVVGGFMYVLDARLPYIANGILYALGALAALFLQGPSIDSERFSIKTLITQQKHGVRELFHAQYKKLILFLLAVGAITLITTEVLDNMLSIEFGFHENQLGVLWAVIYVAAGIVLQILPKSTQSTRNILSTTALCSFVGATLALSPAAGLWIGGTLLLIRSILNAVLNNTNSVIINGFVNSKYRATTLSAFNMLKSLPYLVTALGIGAIADMYSAKTFAVALGIILFILAGFWVISVKDVKGNL